VTVRAGIGTSAVALGKINTRNFRAREYTLDASRRDQVEVCGAEKTRIVFIAVIGEASERRARSADRKVWIVQRVRDPGAHGEMGNERPLMGGAVRGTRRHRRGPSRAQLIARRAQQVRQRGALLGISATTILRWRRPNHRAHTRLICRLGQVRQVVRDSGIVDRGMRLGRPVTSPRDAILTVRRLASLRNGRARKTAYGRFRGLPSFPGGVVFTCARRKIWRGARSVDVGGRPSAASSSPQPRIEPECVEGCRVDQDIAVGQSTSITRR